MVALPPRNASAVARIHRRCCSWAWLLPQLQITTSKAQGRNTPRYCPQACRTQSETRANALRASVRYQRPPTAAESARGNKGRLALRRISLAGQRQCPHWPDCMTRTRAWGVWGPTIRLGPDRSVEVARRPGMSWTSCPGSWLAAGVIADGPGRCIRRPGAWPETSRVLWRSMFLVPIPSRMGGAR
jgi:hypothetical protein